MDTLAWFGMGVPGSFTLVIFALNSLNSNPLAVVAGSLFLLCLGMGFKHMILNINQIRGDGE